MKQIKHTIGDKVGYNFRIPLIAKGWTIFGIKNDKLYTSITKEFSSNQHIVIRNNIRLETRNEII